MSFQTLLQYLQSGGNVALVIACYFIFKATDRLARIERMLESVLSERSKLIDEINHPRECDS
jgi:hypothetical protein